MAKLVCARVTRFIWSRVNMPWGSGVGWAGLNPGKVANWRGDCWQSIVIIILIQTGAINHSTIYAYIDYDLIPQSILHPTAFPDSVRSVEDIKIFSAKFHILHEASVHKQVYIVPYDLEIGLACEHGIGWLLFLVLSLPLLAACLRPEEEERLGSGAHVR